MFVAMSDFVIIAKVVTTERFNDKLLRISTNCRQFRRYIRIFVITGVVINGFHCISIATVSKKEKSKLVNDFSVYLDKKSICNNLQN